MVNRGCRPLSSLLIIARLAQPGTKISRKGTVGPLPGYETFPDVGGKVLGAPTTLPDVLTT